MINRIQISELNQALSSGRLTLISGPVGAGKKTILSQALDELQLNAEYVDCSLKKAQKTIDISSFDNKLIVLIEAQYVTNLQEIVDTVIDGNSNNRLVLLCSFTPNIDADLFDAIRLSGFEHKVYPPSFYEAAQHYGLTEIDRILDQRLIYGNYAQVLENQNDAETYLLNMIHEIIRTNLGVLDRINKEKELFALLRKLAFGIGEIITYHDLGQAVGLDNETVERYIDLLEKSDLIIRLKSYSSGHRYELKKTHCVYFVDNGIRNALIQNFNSNEFRNDMLALWKNYLVSEKIKWCRMTHTTQDFYFWRTHTRQQLDLLEMNNDTLIGYKIDWEKRKKVKNPPYFNTCYPSAKFSILNRNTYWPFLTKKQ